MKRHKQSLTSEQLEPIFKRLAARKNRENKKRWLSAGKRIWSKAERRYVPTASPIVVDWKRIRRSMGYVICRDQFEGSNWAFDARLLRATSYRWWPMLAVIKGVLVRNRYNYSNSTNKHQWALEYMLKDLGIKPEITLYVRSSPYNLESVKQELLEAFARESVRLKYARNKDTWQLKRLEKQMEAVRSIGIRYSKKAIKEALAEAEVNRRERLDWAKEKRNQQAAADLAAKLREAQAPLLALVQGGAQ